MLVWVLKVRVPNDNHWVPWVSYIARRKWMLASRLKNKGCLLADKDTRIVKYNFTKVKESNVQSKYAKG